MLLTYDSFGIIYGEISAVLFLQITADYDSKFAI